MDSFGHQEKVTLLRGIFKDLKHDAADRGASQAPWRYVKKDPTDECLIGIMGEAADPADLYQGARLPSGIGLVLLAVPDAVGVLTLVVSGRFDITLRALPTLKEQTDNLEYLASDILRPKQAVAEVFLRYPIHFEGAEISVDVNNLPRGFFPDAGNYLQKAMQDLADNIPETHRVLGRQADPGERGVRLIPWDESIADDDALDLHVRREMEKNSEDRCPHRARIMTRVRSAPRGMTENKSALLVEVFLQNETTRRRAWEYGLKDGSLLDTEFTVSVVRGIRLRLPHRLIPEDYIYEGDEDVPGYGVNCGVVETPEGGLRSDSMPCVEQALVETPDSVDLGVTNPPSFKSLATNPLPVIEDFIAALERDTKEWETVRLKWLEQGSTERAAAVAIDAAKYNEEIARIRDGADLLNTDKALNQAFRWMNEAMGKAIQTQGKRFDGWRLFQFGFILSSLRAVHERQHPPVRGKRDSETVDVLKFDTGGGKTEAYLGLIGIQMLYDRIRGREYGVAAWMRFPLRMLSVQQFQRLSYMVAQENLIREREKLGGLPFTIGYFTGGGTPNQLDWPGDNGSNRNFLPNLPVDKYQFISDCPYCGLDGSIRMAKNYERVRLLHVCSNTDCPSHQLSGDEVGSIRGEMGIYVSDRECYRYLPTVLVGTLDKLAIIGHNFRFSRFMGGARFFCPDHGFSDSTCEHRRIRQDSTGAWMTESCGLNTQKTPRVVKMGGSVDPGFCLMIQDELHLLQESLGNFDGHYETTLSTLQEAVGGQTPKVLAASATIKEFEHQIHHLYQKRARRFPQPGRTAGESFYARRVTNPDGTPAVRRLYSAVMPHGRGQRASRASAELAARYLRLIHRWVLRFESDPKAAARDLGLNESVADAAMAHIKRQLDTALVYVNSRTRIPEIDMYVDRIGKLVPGSSEGTLSKLTGETSLADIQKTIHEIENKAEGCEPRLLVATSVISHGVDLERLNFMVVTGWPSTTAEYIQSSARSGRVHPGLVVAVLNAISSYESHVFMNYADYHLFLEKLVEAVPINRLAPNVLQRTLPGVLSAVILNWATQQPWGRDIKAHRFESLYKILNKEPCVGRAIEERVIAALQVTGSPIENEFHPRVVSHFEENLRKEVQDAVKQLTVRSQSDMELRITEVIAEALGFAPMESLRDIENQVELIFYSTQDELIAEALAE